jgi:ELWxxDGT repeat protein
MRSRRLLPLICLAALWGRPADPAAGPFRPVADLDPTPIPGSTSGGEDTLETGGLIYFRAVADRPLRRGQLWRTDRTPEGTRLLAEFSGVETSGMAALNGRVLLGARTWPLGNELWTTDGSPEGTAMLADLVPGPASSNPQRFITLGDHVYFIAVEDPSRQLGRLYRTDGTAAGTVCVLSCGGEPPGVVAQPMAALDGALYLARVSGASRELWRSDGTTDGSALVRAYAFGPSMLRVAGGRLTFAADDGLRGLEPWTSDGTFAGTRLVRDIRPGRFGSMDLSLQATAGDLLFFSANDGSRGQELWRSDGTEAGTTLIADLNPGSAGSFPHDLIVSGGILYFMAGAAPQGLDVWRTDGTPDGTSRIAAIPAEAPKPIETPPLVVAAGSLHFAGWDSGHGWEPWHSDGTAEGSAMLQDIRPGAAGSLEAGARGMSGAGERLLIFADDGVHGREPWMSDGTSAGTRLLLDANPVVGTRDAFPGALAAAGGTLFFLSQSPEAIQKTEGVGSLPLTEPGRFSAGSCHDQAASGGRYAVACPPRLWVSDGTRAGTWDAAAPLVVPGQDPDVAFPVPFRDGFLFVLDGDSSALAFTDGTPEGSRIVREFPRIGFERPVSVGSHALLSAAEGDAGRELWRTEGTSGGTLLVQDINPGGADGSPSQLTLMGDRAIFRATDAAHGGELWITDATPSGTRLVRDLTPGAAGTSFTISTLASTAGQGWLVVTRGVESQLYTTDGSGSGTLPVGPPFTGGSSRPHDLVRAGGRVWFVSGTQLWTSDGTDAGTRAVRDFPRAPRSLMALGDMVLFAAGLEAAPFDPRDAVWRSDGTPEGTVAVQDLLPVAWQFEPDHEVTFVRAGRHIFFPADDGLIGEELWSGHASVVAGDLPAAVADLAAELEDAGFPAGIQRSLEARLAAARTPGTRGSGPGVASFVKGLLSMPPQRVAPETARHLAELAEDIEQMFRSGAAGEP